MYLFGRSPFQCIREIIVTPRIDVRPRPMGGIHRRAPTGVATVAALLTMAACGGSAGTTTAAPAPAPESGPRVVQAGAPGEATRSYQGGSLAELEGSAYTEADVDFMQGMIHHHAQALEMTALIPERTTTPAIRQMGLRMEISQTDEIAIMERWLRDRGLDVPEWRPSASGEHAGHASMDHGAMDHGAMGHAMDMDEGMMPGMLTAEQMTSLEAAEGRTFDRLFLELMIQHHEGALAMVRDLYNSPGAAQESIVYHFASEVDADQDIEIRRMRQILEGLR